MRINIDGNERDMTSQEIARLNSLQTSPLQAARDQHRAEMSKQMADALAQGFQPQGVSTWKLRGSDVDKITSDAVYLQTRLLLAPDSDSRAALLGSTINVPTDQGPQPLTIAQAIAAYSEFGSWSRAIIERHEERQRAIQTAPNVEAVEAIAW